MMGTVNRSHGPADIGAPEEVAESLLIGGIREVEDDPALVAVPDRKAGLGAGQIAARRLWGAKTLSVPDRAWCHRMGMEFWAPQA